MSDEEEDRINDEERIDTARLTCETRTQKFFHAHSFARTRNTRCRIILEQFLALVVGGSLEQSVLSLSMVRSPSLVPHVQGFPKSSTSSGSLDCSTGKLLDATSKTPEGRSATFRVQVFFLFLFLFSNCFFSFLTFFLF